MIGGFGIGKQLGKKKGGGGEAYPVWRLAE